jgi:hypothetical protein
MPDQAQKKDPREFAAFLIDRPATHAELTDALQRVTQAVVDTGKSGTITLSITIKPFEKQTDVLQVADAVRVKVPEHDRKPGIFYPDGEGNLTRNDPTAMDWSKLREVPADTRAPKEV